MAIHAAPHGEGSPVMSRRQQIAMNPQEIADYLASQLTVIVVSNGRDGYPHPMPMHFCVEPGGSVAMTTYRKSQKVLNCRRDPHVALLVESGADYAELRGLLIRARAEIVDDHAATVACMLASRAHSNAVRGIVTDAAADAAFAASVVRRAEKRLVLRCHAEDYVSWDHRKLGGVY
jgi:nitroimidazol reductase NimA-like FMN-containing flavoprotein (pyridoxamine 5'-phosphate oxidase superfamily)